MFKYRFILSLAALTILAATIAFSSTSNCIVMMLGRWGNCPQCHIGRVPPL
jgi:hypothetical protein